MGGVLPFWLLIAALGLFLLSTRQFGGVLRTSIWLGGLASAGAAAYLIARDEHYGLLRAFLDLVAHLGDPGDSVIAAAITRNASMVERYVLPLLDMFVVLTAAVGVLALAAFTPGVALERLLRVKIPFVMGAMLGAALTLAVVAIGFGGVVKQRMFVGTVTPDDVYDGDTFWLGEISLRLYGVDAPERRQRCGKVDCGDRARRQLVCLLSGECESGQSGGGVVRCDVQQKRDGGTRESFGRPLVRCFVRGDDGSDFDVGGRLISEGYAAYYRDNYPEEYAEYERQACERGESPYEGPWENPAQVRGRRLNADEPALVGVCASSSDNPR